MPVLSVTQIAVTVLIAVLAAVAAWTIRGTLGTREKHAVDTGWKDELDAQKTESDRLQSQNTSLMQQVNQYRASSQDAGLRARELADALREATAARDGLQRQLRQLRGKLERAVAQRDDLRSDAANRDLRQQAIAEELRIRDERVARLKRDVANWHERVPPLVERYRVRDREARQLEAELDEARTRIAELEAWRPPGDTRLEPMDSLPESLDASNDQYEETSHHDMTGFDDQPSIQDGFDVYSESYSTLDDDATRRDDLKRIKGVGPAIEKILNELGFYRFAQIAGLTHDDVARISQRLHGFGSRIERDDWAGQARLLKAERREER